MKSCILYFFFKGGHWVSNVVQKQTNKQKQGHRLYGYKICFKKRVIIVEDNIGRHIMHGVTPPPPV